MSLIIGHNPAPPAARTTDAAAPPTATTDAMIVDATQDTFMAEVIEASRTVPVLVDFWATWCGPCKTLTPALEKVTKAAGGRVKLVKIDIDQNRALVQQLVQLGLPLQSVPTVAAFWQGQIADLFQGALPESEVKRFVEALLKVAGGAMPAADLLAEAKAAGEAGHFEDAAELYTALIETDQDHAEAWGGLIRAFTALGQDEQAHQALADLPPTLAEHAEITGARSALELSEQGRAARAQLATFEARLAADPADHQSRIDLAIALNAMDRREDAAESLLEVIRRDRNWNEGAARLQLLKLFEAWGFDDEATMAARRRLSALLFS